MLIKFFDYLRMGYYLIAYIFQSSVTFIIGEYDRKPFLCQICSKSLKHRITLRQRLFFRDYGIHVALLFYFSVVFIRKAFGYKNTSGALIPYGVREAGSGNHFPVYINPAHIKTLAG